MRRLALLVGGFWLSLLLAAGLLFGLGLDAHLDPAGWQGAGPALALAGVALLVGDVVLVVPSSLVMVAHGALFGVVGGAALSTLGGLGAAAAGWGLGRFGDRLTARFAPDEDPRLARFLKRYGLVAVVLSRPVPILAETVAVLCGATGRPLGPVALAAAIGTIPPAAVYAWAGAHASAGGSAWLTVGLVLLAAGGAWLIGRPLSSSQSHDAAEPG